MDQNIQKSWLKYLVCVLLAGITCAAYAAIANYPYICLDDGFYVLNNTHIQQGFSGKTIRWAFTAFYANNWHPLTWLSHLLDYQFFTLDPAGPHLVNLAFHVTNTILLFLLLEGLTSRIWPAALAALLFGIHPLHVESVAWVSERKDVLSAFFFLLTLLAYARYVELSRAKKRLRWAVYGLTLLLGALGLLSKPMLVTLPGILCLFDYWPLARFQWPLAGPSRKILLGLVLEKIPFIVLAMFCSWLTYHVQNNTGAVKTDLLDPESRRLAHLPVAYGWYVFKVFWPVNLSIYYLLPVKDSSQDELLGILLLVIVTAFAVLRIRKYPWFLVGWFWFVGMLVPVIGLVQVGNQAYADRYTYLPYIGLFIMLAWGIQGLLAKILRPQPAFFAVIALGGILCFWRTTVELRYWRNSIVLFQRAVALEPKNEMAWMLLGDAYENYGNFDKAIECMTRATTVNNQFNTGWYALGHVLAQTGNYTGAISAYQSAIACVWFNGDKAKMYEGLGDAYKALGQDDDAISAYQNSLELFPGEADVQYHLAQCFSESGQPDQAMAYYQDAIHADPDYLNAHLDLAMLLARKGREAEAIPEYRKVIELDTNIVIALNNLAWIRATAADPQLRNGREAVPLAERACERTKFQQAFFIGTLAAAYAEAGRYQDAAAAAKKAHDVALAHGEQTIADRNAQLAKLYQSGQAFHMDAQPSP